jgi:AcrR family transcriptional regulator
MTSDESPAKPPQVIWARLARPARGGPHPSLTHEQIARVAIDIADAEGIEALSMRKVAARLDAGTMSLYRYVATKDDLVDLMVDAVLGEEQVPVTPSQDWPAELAEMARRTRRTARRHPWAVRLTLARPTVGPNALRMLEYAMACVDRLGLDIDAMLDLVGTVNAFAVGYVQAELAEEEAQRRTGLTEEQWRARMGPYLLGLVQTGEYPYLEKVIVEAEDYPDVDATFERRLAHVLDGLAAGLPREAAPAPASGEAPAS